MALRKEVTYKGLTCTYHKVVGTYAEFYNSAPNADSYTKIDVMVALYKDAEHRDAEVEHYLRVKGYHFLASQPHAPANEKVARIYRALKRLPEFDGAEDV